MKKISKRVLSVLLATLMVVSIIPMNVFTTKVSAAFYNTGDIITFGSYPQTKVTDTETITALNLLTCDSNGDATYNSAKYRRVCFEQYTPYQTDLTPLAENSYQDDNGYNTDMVYWFKYEPIQWRILSNTNGELFVMAESILDSRAYNQVNCGVTWETCTLRNWLNNSFYNSAFTSAEQAQVKTSDVVNADNPTAGTEGGYNTSDKLFLLSYDESLTTAYGFGSNPNAPDTTRQAKGTDFSKSNGLYIYPGVTYTGNSYWWSRSPGNSQEYAIDINISGGYNDDNINFAFAGVRPVMNFTPTYETPFTVTFDANGGTGGTSVSMNFGTAIYPPTVARAGWTFSGWSPTVQATVPGENVTYMAQWINDTYDVGDSINLGSYPQTKVTNSLIINSLNSLTCEANGDVTYDGTKYRRVYFDTVNGYQSNNGYYADTVYWFKYEPIQWRVLSNTNDLFVMADKILDSKSYNQVNTGVTWETCTLRSWLNNDFYNAAFSSTEKVQILSSEVVNKDNPYNGTEGGVNTSDNLFLLSISEVRNAAYGFGSDADRQAQGSDFSKSNGLSISSNNGDWWLRSPGGGPRYAGFVDSDGTVNDYDNSVYNTYLGARPAFKLNLSSDIFTSATVTFDANGGTGSTSGSMICGTGLTAPTVVRTGYTFTGWSPLVPSTVPELDTTYTAQWSQNSYTVTFDANGGENGTSGSMLYGTTLTAPAVTKTGYILIGWTPAVPSTVPAVDTTYTAQWITENSSTITFNANGGTGGTVKTIEIGAHLTAPPVARTGYTFAGWSPAVPATVPEADTTYTAQWTANNYSITYSSNSATGGNTADSSHTYDVAANLTANGFTKTGCTFLGWSTSSSAAAPTFTDIQNVLNLTATNGAMITFYAVWQANNYLITFDANGGSGGTSTLRHYGTALSAPAVTKRGYAFTGWSPNVPTTVPAENVTYTAQWRGNGYIVGDIIAFGSYPQTKVTSTATINALNSLSCDANGDVTYGGAKYKKVCFTRYTSYNTTGVQNAANSYQDDNDYYTNTVYWFQYEPIKWRVLSSLNDEVFVIAEKVLDSKAYSQTDSAATWESCSLRSWLNNDFYNTAFSSTEKVQILSSEVVNEDNPYYGTEGGVNTNDNLFLPSYSEVTNQAYGFDSSFSVYDSARQAQGTDFAKSNGLMVYSSGSYAGNSLWRLRSPGCEPNYAGDVYGTGVVGSGDYDFVHGTYTGVRPCLRLNIIVFNQKNTTQVDTGSGYVTNLVAAQTTVSNIKSNIVSSNIRFVDKNGNIMPDSSIIGTGARVQLLNSSNNTIDELTFVVYGDATGDGNIDSIDASVVVDVENYLIDWDIVKEAAFIKAADVNGDGNNDSIDAGLAVDVENYLLTVDQNTGLVMQN